MKSLVVHRKGYSMRQPSFSLKRASRITAFAELTVNHAGLDFE